MSAPVYLNAMHLVSPAGNGVQALFGQIASHQSCLKLHEDPALSARPFVAGLLTDTQWALIRSMAPAAGFTDFEALAYAATVAACDNLEINRHKTAFILSTTKGNIAGLGTLPDERIALHSSACRIGNALHFEKSLVISQACISGLSAILYASRLLQGNRYENVVVTGADLVSRFVLSGFQSFHAIDKFPCRPFDVSRNGINLGEAAATVILSRRPEKAIARLAGGAVSNDANHISGPSRTGAELSMAIDAALRQAGIDKDAIDAISAHGTATIYNDEMESRAFALSGLLEKPLHSAKGATGHTLGTAGVLESVLVAACLQQQIMLPSLGFETLGVPEKVTVCRESMPAKLDYMLKTASGFGGCNAALIWAAVS